MLLIARHPDRRRPRELAVRLLHPDAVVVLARDGLADMEAIGCLKAENQRERDWNSHATTQT